MVFSHKTLFLGIISGILMIIFLSGLIAAPLEVSASSGPVSNETNTCSLGASYPQAIHSWCGWIEHYSRESGLDPKLIAAIMLQESGGSSQAYSHSGAVGLMQVMPRDGIAASFMCPNGPCFASRPSMEELFDPEFNISYGVRMLAGLVNKYGNARDALKAYGPMDVGYYYADLVLNIYQNYQ
ncbi:MAG: transglycosylase SLT domain-containing protein [Anaerolineaceae bacterium]|nr:transglycosylase SLT domain-containing protein [Anaerolineaceae bacterium]